MTIKQIDDLLAQAESPLQRMILLAQLSWLRQAEAKRNQLGQASPEALLTIFMVGLLLLGGFGVGIVVAAAAHNMLGQITLSF